jgi:hypothetical protein
MLGHHALAPDALALEPAQRGDEEAGDRLALLIRQDLEMRPARGAVDRDVGERPPGPSEAPAASAGDLVSDAAEAGGHPGIEVAGLVVAGAIASPRRRARLQRCQPPEPQPPKVAGDGAPGQAKAQGDLLAGQPLPAPRSGNHHGRGTGRLLATRCGAELRFARPAQPSRRERASHLRAMRGLTQSWRRRGRACPPRARDEPWRPDRTVQPG